MRFSQNQVIPPSNPDRSRARRQAKFLGDLKGEIREAANVRGFSASDLARALNRNRSSVSRTLDPSTNVEAFTLFDYAEVLGMTWAVKLCDPHDKAFSAPSVAVMGQVAFQGQVADQLSYGGQQFGDTAITGVRQITREAAPLPSPDRNAAEESSVVLLNLRQGASVTTTTFINSPRFANENLLLHSNNFIAFPDGVPNTRGDKVQPTKRIGKLKP